ncbi:uncharacterized protein LOC111026899 [Myzus persicae]|uniref:uncharacterized protein LOC111026899 n=1 Tax=Myzus persicae TaxID=13164 RepID=UPI000B932C32|nr:uncharacterized protein LOC111026899 [Myzus persicae]
MDYRSTVTKPQTYSGKITENVVQYFDTFERIAKANQWGEAEKLIMIPLYLRDQAIKLLDRIENKSPILTWEIVKNDFINHYNSEDQIEMPRENLYKQTKHVDENIQDYVLKILSECKRPHNEQNVDSAMKNEINELKETVKSLMNNTPQKSTVNKNKKHCTYCGLNKHEELQCYKKANKDKMCTFCELKFHTEDICYKKRNQNKIQTQPENN